MFPPILLFAFCLSLALGKYSYTDKCYRFEKAKTARQTQFYQIYVNRKGIPLSNDAIIYYRNGELSLAYSYYYHNVLTDCVRVADGFNCTNTCESGWFKVWNATAQPNYGKYCDEAFMGKYANVMEYSCRLNPDPFTRIKREIGKSHDEFIAFDDGKPAAPQGYSKDAKCIWEYDILGLWSMVTLIIVCVIVLVVLILLALLIVFTQKHRADKRKRLEGSLIRSSANGVWIVY